MATPPKPGKGDVAHALARAGLRAIPVAGAAATELLNAIVTPLLERRMQQWMEAVAEAFREIEATKGINLEDLRNNDVFIDIVLQASQIALRSSQEEKLEALRNAVLSAALLNPPENKFTKCFSVLSIF